MMHAADSDASPSADRDDRAGAPFDRGKLTEVQVDTCTCTVN